MFSPAAGVHENDVPLLTVVSCIEVPPQIVASLIVLTVRLKLAATVALVVNVQPLASLTDIE